MTWALPEGEYERLVKANSVSGAELHKAWYNTAQSVESHLGMWASESATDRDFLMAYAEHGVPVIVQALREEFFHRTGHADSVGDEQPITALTGHEQGTEG